MRTTVNLSPEVYAVITGYVDAYDRLHHRRPSVSEVVEECVSMNVPILVERLPTHRETPEQALLRRAATLQARIKAPGLGTTEVEKLMKEGMRLVDDARATFLRDKGRNDIDAYQRCADAGLAVYNVGATRFNAA